MSPMQSSRSLLTVGAQEMADGLRLLSQAPTPKPQDRCSANWREKMGHRDFQGKKGGTGAGIQEASCSVPKAAE